MSEEHPVIPTRQSAGSLLRQMLLQELTIGDGPVGQMDMLSIIANAADWLDEAVAGNATTATLTDAERDVMEWLSAAGDETRDTHKTLTPVMRSAIRGLLERTK